MSLTSIPEVCQIRQSLGRCGNSPRVYADGDLLIDGGTLDNVPAEAMRARVGGGTVAAVGIRFR